MDIEVLIAFLAIAFTLSIGCYSYQRYLKHHSDSLGPGNQKSAQSRISLQRKALSVAALTFAWYAVSITLSIYNKWLMSEFDGGFKYPLLATSVHMTLKYIFSRMWYYGYAEKDSVAPLQSVYLSIMVVLIGVCTAADIALSNESILYISLTLYTVLKATVVVFTFVWAVGLGVEQFRWKV
jgi:solute carrier family 35 protein C2